MDRKLEVPGRHYLANGRRVAKVPSTITAACRQKRASKKIAFLYCVFLSFPTKVSESHERGEGDHHELRSLRTKVEAQKHRKVTTTKEHKSAVMLARRQAKRKFLRKLEGRPQRNHKRAVQGAQQ